MAQQIYKVARLSDEQIASVLETLAEEFGPFSMETQIFLHSIGSISFPANSENEWNKLIDLKSELIFHFYGVVLGVTITYYRGGMQGQAHEKSAVFDDLGIDIKGIDQTQIKFVSRVLSLFRPIQIPRPEDSSGLVEAQRAIQESTFSRLQHQLEQLFQQTVDVRAKLDEAVQKKEALLQEKFDDKLRIAETDIAEKRTALIKEAADLEIKRKTLDDSDNTFARRQIRDRMLSDVSDRVQNFSVSNATLKSRLPVARGMFLLITFLGILFMWTSFEIYQARYEQNFTSNLWQNAPIVSAPNAFSEKTNEIIALWIRLSLATFGLVASLIYYIRWANQWATQFSTTEQSLKQFHIDVNRANWVVETCLEWRKENQSDIPANLADSLTRGLFTGREQSSQVLHPADELASALMGSASKLSLDLNGNKLEINKPQKIPKTLEV